MKSNKFFLLIKNAYVVAPEAIVKKDILIANGKIVAIEDGLDSGSFSSMTDVYDAEGDYVLPGLIDQHVHLIGGGGEDGFASRTPAVSVENIIRSGITTVVGVLGTDGNSRSVKDLLAKANALDSEGISVRIHTGSYEIPSITLCGDIGTDIAYIDKVIGVKAAMSDHRSSCPTARDLVNLGTKARVAGMLSGKPGIVHIHVGSGKEGLDPLFKAVEISDLPARQFSPTHLTRSKELFEEALRFARLGAFIDITADATGCLNRFTTMDAIADCPKDLLCKLTVSSDGNGSMPVFGATGNLISMGIGNQSTLLKLLKEIVEHKVLSLPEAIQVFSSNVAANIGLSQSKGRIITGYDADLTIMNKDLTLRSVVSKGIIAYRDGELLSKGYYS